MKPLFRKKYSNSPVILLQKGAWLLSTLFISIWFSWHLMAQANFLYPVWYNHGGVKENIEQYALQNNFRPDFEHTSDEKRLELFAGIVFAIQNQGYGLSQLSYQNDTGTIPLLREAEIIHLQDVANLIDVLNRLLWGIFLLWIILTILILAKKNQVPNIKQASIFFLALFIITIITLIYYGAENIFYQMHVWVFPSENQWFFYYQDSLMSTMMKAPHIFAYIAVSLTILATAIFYLLLTIFQRPQIT